MSRKKLISRLSWYYPTERFNAFIFSGIIILVITRFGFKDKLFLIYGLSVMTIILFQGQYYWKLKLQRLTNRDFDQRKNIELFKKCKRINLVLLGSIPLVLLFQLVIYNWVIKPGDLFVWAVLANIAGILEHVNYYYRQIMVDNISDLKYLMRNKKLKIASLRKDLKENQI